MTTLEWAIENAGSQRELAKRYKLTESTISNWKTRGMPKGWAMYFEAQRAKAPENKAIEPRRAKA